MALSDHDERWKCEYELTAKTIHGILGENIMAVYHIGSTAIRGIAAKPILDINVAVKSIEGIDIAGMERSGYEPCGEAGVPGRCLFVLRQGDLSLHHIHCYAAGHSELLEGVLFRDYLNAHPDRAVAYGALKEALAAKYPDDRVRYTDGKAHFIRETIELAKRWAAREGAL